MVVFGSDSSRDLSTTLGGGDMDHDFSSLLGGGASPTHPMGGHMGPIGHTVHHHHPTAFNPIDPNDPLDADDQRFDDWRLDDPDHDDGMLAMTAMTTRPRIAPTTRSFQERLALQANAIHAQKTRVAIKVLQGSGKKKLKGASSSSSSTTNKKMKKKQKKKKSTTKAIRTKTRLMLRSSSNGPLADGEDDDDDDNDHDSDDDDDDDYNNDDDDDQDDDDDDVSESKKTKASHKKKPRKTNPSKGGGGEGGSSGSSSSSSSSRKSNEPKESFQYLCTWCIKPWKRRSWAVGHFHRCEHVQGADAIHMVADFGSKKRMEEFKEQLEKVKSDKTALQAVLDQIVPYKLKPSTDELSKALRNQTKKPKSTTAATDTSGPPPSRTDTSTGTNTSTSANGPAGPTGDTTTTTTTKRSKKRQRHQS